MSKSGLSVIIGNEYEFNQIKQFLGSKAMYLNYNPIIENIETSVVIHSPDEKLFSPGSLGSSEYHKKNSIKVLKFKDYFI